MPIPRLLFPISSDLKNTWLSDETAHYFEGNNFVVHCDRGSYVPEFDNVEQSVRGLTRTLTPFHRTGHMRFSVTCQDNRELVYWILKQLEVNSFSGTTYTPIQCVDYVLPDIGDRAQGYSTRQSAQFNVSCEGMVMVKGVYQKYKDSGSLLSFKDWELINGDRFFDKISFTYEILRVGA
jgi:hypothetical protein